MAGLFQIGEGRIDDARARAVPAGGLVLEHFDDLVAVPGLLRDQGERNQPQVALGQHAPRPHEIAAPQVALHAVASAAAEAGPEMAAPAMAGGPLALEGRSKMSAEHCAWLLWRCIF